MEIKSSKFSLIYWLKRIYFLSTGYSYTNLGRMFLRLFLGIMLMQFGTRQWMEFEEISRYFPSIIGMGSEASLIVMICIEIICSLCIMVGFLTRLMSIPPFVAMIIAQHYLMTNPIINENLFSFMQPVFLPMMFMGILFFILLVGPGKISVDYFLSLHIIHADNKSEGELEEV